MSLGSGTHYGARCPPADVCPVTLCSVEDSPVPPGLRAGFLAPNLLHIAPNQATEVYIQSQAMHRLAGTESELGRS